MNDAKMKSRIVLCILHDAPYSIRELCGEYPQFEYDEEFSGQGHAGRMWEAFALSDNTVRPTLGESDKQAIAKHQNVAYVLSPRLDSKNGLAEAARALRFVDGCFKAGARAVKCESSGLAHGRDSWQEMAGRGEDATLYWAWVRRPLGDSGVIYSCGMHLLGFPDIEVCGEEVAAALQLIDLFAMYLLVDKPGDRLKDGDTFSLSPDSPSYRVTKESCCRYPEDDFFFNPNGYWHLERV